MIKTLYILDISMILHLPVLEAINLDTLVLCSSLGSLSEFGEYDIKYFNPYNKEELIGLMNNIDNFSFSQKDKKYLLDKYNWNVVKKQIKNLYKDYIDV